MALVIKCNDDQCDGEAKRMSSRMDYVILQCRKCKSVFDHGIKVLEDKLHNLYVRNGEPDHRSIQE